MWQTYISNCPTRCNTKQSIYYSANSLYMFRVSTTPVIRNTQNCNYCLRYCAATYLQRDQASLATLEGGSCTKNMSRGAEGQYQLRKALPTWSDNTVRELIAVKVLHTSLLNTTGSPWKYSTWEAMYRCQRLVHPSKQFWNWFCGMVFRAAVVLLLMSSKPSKYLTFNIYFIFGNRKMPLEARSGEQAGCSNTVICLVAKNSLTVSAAWAGELSWCKIYELLAKCSSRFRLTFSPSLSSTFR